MHYAPIRRYLDINACVCCYELLGGRLLTQLGRRTVLSCRALVKPALCAVLL